MTKFQIILTGIFAAFIIIGVAIFAVGGNDSSKDISRVTLWGTMTVQDFSGFTRLTVINYVNADLETVGQDLGLKKVQVYVSWLSPFSSQRSTTSLVTLINDF